VNPTCSLLESDSLSSETNVVGTVWGLLDVCCDEMVVVVGGWKLPSLVVGTGTAVVGILTAEFMK
jgi:hypothetical protein